MKDYTVLLLRPDYVAENYGEDTYMTCVSAESVTEAQGIAQREVAFADLTTGDEDEQSGCVQAALEKAEDYLVLLVIAGQHNDIKELE